MADGRAEDARMTAQPASGDLRAQIDRAYASSAPIVEDEHDARRTPPAGPLPETAARFAAAMAAVEQSQSVRTAGDRRSGSSAAPPQGPPPTAARAPQRDPRAAQPASGGVRRPRRARLRLTHIDPWSVMKTSLLLSIALGIVTVVAVAVVWAVLNASGLWDSINQTVGEVVGTQSSENFRIQDYVGTERVLGFTMLVAAVDVVLITVVATLGAFLYNLAAALLGGLEVVLAEDEF
jgi:hypothetical protein